MTDDLAQQLARAVLVLAIGTMSGCDQLPPPTTTNECAREQIFQACLKALPAGPASTHYNDWDDVVDSCESHAYYTAQQIRSTVPLQCRGPG